jgi:S1-C subfamily serine protease
MDENVGRDDGIRDQPPAWPGAAGEAPKRARGYRGATVAVAGSLALAVALGGVALGRDLGGSSTTAGSGTAAGSTTTGQFGPGTGFGGSGGTGFGGSGGTGTNGGGTGTNGGGTSGSGTSGSGTSGSGTSGTTSTATSAESAGVVDVTTVLDYGSGEAAGTGIVLTAGGEILTNNHVVAGATKITVTVVSTGRSYPASVVGTDPTDDVALLRLADASGLTTAKLATSTVAVGDAVTAVGNAGGTGGTPTAATGSVVALDQSITASDGGTGSDAEQLSGLIETDAAIQPGDSGGPLYADGAVVGIDTAASSGQTVVGFAIPIGTATAIADRIASGEDSDTIQQGTPAFLGVELANGTSGATIAGVVTGSAAADAGLQAGDTITAVDGTAVGSASTLSSVLGAHAPGDQVRIAWTDAGGTSHTATVTLIAGPAG